MDGICSASGRQQIHQNSIPLSFYSKEMPWTSDMQMLDTLDLETAAKDIGTWRSIIENANAKTIVWPC